MNKQELIQRAQKALREVEDNKKYSLKPEEKGLIQGMANGYEAFMTDAAETLLDSIETAHAIGGKGLRSPMMPGGAHRAELTGVKVHHGAHGEVYELASGAKLAHVIKGQEPAPVSLDRWLAAALLGDRCQDKAAVEYAHDAKSVSSGTSGVLLPVGYQAEWTDLMRAQMVLEAAGMTTVTMNNPTVTSSRILTDPTVGWRAEGGSLTASDPTFELQNLVAKSLYVRTKATAELVADSPDWGGQLLAVMSRALATEVDRAGLMGLGSSNQPRGLHNTVGINTQAKGSLPYHDTIIMGFQKCLEANCALSDVEGNVIMSPRTWGQIATTRTTDGLYIDGTPEALKRAVYRPTTAVPNNLGVGANESVMFVGDFKQLVLGVRQEATVEALKLQSYGDNLLLEFVGTARVDFLCRRPASFTELTGLLPPA